jgi:hypothetical protein
VIHVHFFFEECFRRDWLVTFPLLVAFFLTEELAGVFEDLPEVVVAWRLDRPEIDFPAMTGRDDLERDCLALDAALPATLPTAVPTMPPRTAPTGPPIIAPTTAPVAPPATVLLMLILPFLAAPELTCPSDAFPLEPELDFIALL